MENVAEIMRSLDLPEEVQSRVRSYYEYVWLRTKCLDISELHKDLSPALDSGKYSYN